MDEGIRKGQGVGEDGIDASHSVGRSERIIFKLQDKIRDILKKEIIGIDEEVQESFISHFNNDISEIIDSLTIAWEKWVEYYSKGEINERKKFVSAYLLDAIDSLTVSTKLYISGYAVPSNYMMRRIIESISMAALCSSTALNVFERVADNRYSINKAVIHLNRNAHKLNIKKEAADDLKKAYDYYHEYSHSSIVSLSHLRSLSSPNVYIGSKFDHKKIDGNHGYKWAMKARVSAAFVLINVFDGIEKIK